MLKSSYEVAGGDTSRNIGDIGRIRNSLNSSINESVSNN